MCDRKDSGTRWPSGTTGSDPLLRITYFGKTAFGLESKDTIVLLNPGIWDGEPVVPDDFDCRVIAVTNQEEDALGNAATIAVNAKAWILGNEPTTIKAQELGAKPWLLHALKPEVPYEIPGLKVTPFPLQKRSKTGVIIENLGLHIEMGGMKVSYLGDSLVRGPFEQLETNVMIVPVGGDSVFEVKDAVSLCIDAKPQVGVPVRWIDEEQPKKFAKYINQFGRGTTPVIMEPGQVLEVQWAAGNEFRHDVSRGLST
ncbi:MAG: MBL fold metallo-hydrolase [Candidatus Hodarchaeota archaeon]